MKKLLFSFYFLILIGTSSILAVNPSINHMKEMFEKVKNDQWGIIFLGSELASNKSLGNEPELIDILKNIINQIDSPWGLSSVVWELAVNTAVANSLELKNILNNAITKLEAYNMGIPSLIDSLGNKVTKVNKKPLEAGERGQARESLNQLIDYSLVYKQLPGKNPFGAAFGVFIATYKKLGRFFAQQGMANEQLVISVELHDLYDSALQEEENHCKRLKLENNKKHWAAQVFKLLPLAEKERKSYCLDADGVINSFLIKNYQQIKKRAVEIAKNWESGDYK